MHRPPPLPAAWLVLAILPAEAWAADGLTGLGNFGLMDLVLAGVLIFLAVRIFSRWRGPRPPSGQGPDQTGRPETKSKLDRYRLAEHSWQRLQAPAARDRQEAAPGVASAAAEAGFDSMEFLRGAKAAYARVLQAYDERDFEDLSQFATPDAVEEFRRQVSSGPEKGKTDILLLEARMMGVDDEAGQTVASVAFEALLRDDPRQDTPRQVREIWHFAKPSGSAKATWKLTGREPGPQ
jgi:predicted lipid-binding transport protein (Tim44 family)